MPFTFVEIERKTTSIIGPLFLAVVSFYFLTAYLVLLVGLNSWRLVTLPAPGLVLPPGDWVWMTILFATVVGFSHWYISTANMIGRMCQGLGARPYDPNDGYHRVARNIVDEVSVAGGGIPIDLVIIPGAYANAFALADFQGTNLIGLTEGLLCRLNRSQLEAVIAHEAGHIVSGDCQDTTLVCALAEVYEDTAARIFRVLGKLRKPGVFGLVLLIVALVISAMNVLSRLMRCFISRQRELRADALAVRMTRDPQSLAEALTLIGIHWRGEGDPGERMQSVFIVNPRYQAVDEAQGWFADLFSTHPPIRQRVAVLAEMVRLLPGDIAAQLSSQQAPGPVLAVAPADAGSAGEIRCPRCRQPLEDGSCEGAPLLLCRSCAGVLAGNEALQRLFIRQGSEFSDEVRRLYEQLRDNKMHIVHEAVLESAWQLQCPRCQSQMRRGYYNSSYPVEVDRCINCSSVWLDRLELQLLQYIYEHREEFFRHE